MFRSAKRAVKAVLGNAGYSVVKTKTTNWGHECIYPQATYAPWSLDRKFLHVYDSIRSYTLVDKYRCWELWNLVRQTERLSGDFIEVGVWRGGTGCLIAKRVKMLGLNCDVFLCDTFCGVVKAGPMDDVYQGGEHADTCEESVGALAQRLGVDPRFLKGVFPEETARQIEDRRFRFCHVDVDVYQSACDSTRWVWPRLVSGGIVVFDDFGFQGCDGVRKFVEEWTANSACTLLHNLNGHAILVKP